VTTPWWAALPPAEAGIACGRSRHVLRWENGTMAGPAHPDAEAEQILGVLGGGPQAACVEVSGMWQRLSADLDVLAFGPRQAADQIAVAGDNVAASRSEFASRLRRRQKTVAAGRTSAGRVYAVRTGPGPPSAEEAAAWTRRLELLTLLALGPAFQVRLAGTVAAAWSGPDQAGARAAYRPRLTAALTGRLAPVVESWLGAGAGPVLATVHEGPGWGRVEPDNTEPDNTEPGGAGGTGAGLRASLPLDWLARVWSCGLAVVDGHLVVGVRSADWPCADVLALPRPGATPVTFTVRAGPHPAGGPLGQVWSRD
jgi:hypothetical protein